MRCVVQTSARFTRSSDRFTDVHASVNDDSQASAPTRAPVVPLPIPVGAAVCFGLGGHQPEAPAESSGEDTMKILATTLVMFLLAMPVNGAADNLRAFPPAAAGMTRFVLQLPPQTDEYSLKVELMIGKTVQVDAHNRYFFAGTIEEQTVHFRAVPVVPNHHEIKALVEAVLHGHNSSNVLIQR